MNIPFLTQKAAQAVDVKLVENFKYHFHQLIELAGLACAQAIVQEFPVQNSKHILFYIGPGNNGADGLVCARFCQVYGYQCSIHYPKRKESEIYNRLVSQCQAFGIPFLDDPPSSKNFDLIVDAMFGFSFKGKPRPPFDSIIQSFESSAVPVFSIDVPSGWDVETGPTEHSKFQPACLISLTAPKLCAKFLNSSSSHYLGGRFVPPSMAKEIGLDMSLYKSPLQCTKVNSPTTSSSSSSSTD